MPFKAYIRLLFVTACFATGGVVSGCVTEPAPYSVAQVPSDLPRLRRLAERGDATAANNLGVAYANGTGVPQDFAEARKWYEFASQHGNPAAEYHLGIAYQRGQGTAIDMAEALKWFRLAAEHGYAPAKLILAMMYRDGKSMPPNGAEAMRLTRDAAREGMSMAQFIMAKYYSDDAEVPADDSLAYQWASLAASQLSGGLGMAAKAMRDTAAKGLSPAELTAAQAATAAWKQGTDLVSLLPAGIEPRAPRLRGSASGFVVGKDGEIATDFHVVPNCREIRLIDSAGKSNAMTRVLGEDRADDLAILAGGGFGTRLKIRSNRAELGENITSYGFPLVSMLSGTGNLTTGSVSGTTGMMGAVKAFQISAPVQTGSSGGPVVDASGAVVGIVAAKLNALGIAAATGDLAQNVNFAWRIDLLRALMDRNGIAYEQSGKGQRRSAVALAGLLQKATVKIECWR